MGKKKQIPGPHPRTFVPGEWSPRLSAFSQSLGGLSHASPEAPRQAWVSLYRVGRLSSLQVVQQNASPLSSLRVVEVTQHPSPTPAYTLSLFSSFCRYVWRTYYVLDVGISQATRGRHAKLPLGPVAVAKQRLLVFESLAFSTSHVGGCVRGNPSVGWGTPAEKAGPRPALSPLWQEQWATPTLHVGGGGGSCRAEGVG